MKGAMKPPLAPSTWIPRSHPVFSFSCMARSTFNFNFLAMDLHLPGKTVRHGLLSCRRGCGFQPKHWLSCRVWLGYISRSCTDLLIQGPAADLSSEH